MNYQFKTKRKNTSPFLLWGSLLVALSFLIVVFFVPNLFSGISHSIARMVLGDRGATEKEISLSLTSFFSSKKALLEEVEELKSTIRSIQLKEVHVEEVEKENKELKALLGRKTSDETVVGYVLSRPPQSPYDTFILDVGREDKVSVGDRVVFQGTAIGEIVEIFKKTSIVELFSTPGTKFNIRIGDDVNTVAEGVGNGSFIAKIPRGESVRAGEPVVSMDEHVHVVGIVEFVDTVASDPFQTIFFTSPVVISEVRLVEIIPIKTSL